MSSAATKDLIILATAPITWFAIMYLIAPLIVMSKHRSYVGGSVPGFDLNLLNAETRGFFIKSVNGLAAQGFVLIDYVTKPNASTGVTPIVAYLIQPENQDKALVAAFWVVKNGVPSIKGAYIEITSRYADGTWLTTSNSGGPRAFRRTAQGHSNRFPDVKDPAQLYGLHRFLTDREVGQKEKVLPPAGKELEAFDRANRESFESQAELGMLNFDPAANCYTLTVFGAYYMTWCQLWPIKQVRRWLEQTRAKRLFGQYQAKVGYFSGP